MMTRTLTLDLPEEVDRALQDESARTGKSREQVVTEWLRQHVSPAPRGTVDAIMPFFGSWSMTDDERQDIERMIEEERLMEEDDD